MSLDQGGDWSYKHVTIDTEHEYLRFNSFSLFQGGNFVQKPLPRFNISGYKFMLSPRIHADKVVKQRMSDAGSETHHRYENS